MNNTRGQDRKKISAVFLLLLAEIPSALGNGIRGDSFQLALNTIQNEVPKNVEVGIFFSYFFRMPPLSVTVLVELAVHEPDRGDIEPAVTQLCF